MTKETSRGLLLAILLSASSCSNDVIYTDSVAMKDEVWKLAQVPDFSVTVNDTTQLTDVSFTIRTGSAYPYRNIWLFVTAYSPDRKTLSDTLEYFLADEKGNWFGRGFGDIHELSLPYKSGVYFPVQGTYRFSIQHGMRAGDLEGVYDFGLRIVKSPV